MDGLARAVGDGIGSLVGGAVRGIGAAFDGIVGSLDRVIPHGFLPVVVIGVVIVVGWLVLKR